jgi:L-iditol 2-dehydrogenase
MKAAVLYGKEDVRIERMSVPQAGPGEVVVRVGAALTCGTDVKVFKRGYHARMIVPPAVFGHEMAGVVEEIGAGVRGFAPGMRVVAANSAPCDACEYCRAGRPGLCEDLLFWNGAYAEYVKLPARVVKRNLLVLPESVAFHQAALIEPLACAIRGVEECRIQEGQTVVVIGVGPLGLMLIFLAARAGARVIAVGRKAERLAHATALGAAESVAVSKGDLADALLDRSVERRGFAAVIEAVGKAETSQAALQIVRKGGVVNFFGGCAAGTEIRLDLQRFHYQELTALATFHHTPGGIRQAFEIVTSGGLDVDQIVTGTGRLEELPRILAEYANGERSLKTAIYAS